MMNLHLAVPAADRLPPRLVASVGRYLSRIRHGCLKQPTAVRLGWTGMFDFWYSTKPEPGSLRPCRKAVDCGRLGDGVWTPALGLKESLQYYYPSWSLAVEEDGQEASRGLSCQRTRP
jgi:hypothetical protein